MHLSESRKPSRLPARFPVGTTYVVEGRGDKNGQLRVFSRYVVFPSGRRVNLADDVDSQGKAGRHRAAHVRRESSLRSRRKGRGAAQ